MGREDQPSFEKNCLPDDPEKNPQKNKNTQKKGYAEKQGYHKQRDMILRRVHFPSPQMKQFKFMRDI